MRGEFCACEMTYVIRPDFFPLPQPCLSPLPAKKTFRPEQPQKKGCPQQRAAFPPSLSPSLFNSLPRMYLCVRIDLCAAVAGISNSAFPVSRVMKKCGTAEVSAGDMHYYTYIKQRYLTNRPLEGKSKIKEMVQFHHHFNIIQVSHLAFGFVQQARF